MENIEDVNKALSNLAFLDLSDEEREKLKARYRALNQKVNEAEASEALKEPTAEDIIGHLDPTLLAEMKKVKRGEEKFHSEKATPVEVVREEPEVVEEVADDQKEDQELSKIEKDITKQEEEISQQEEHADERERQYDELLDDVEQA